MKIIKSFFLVTISLCATTLLHAQELKAEVGKPVEIKQPSADNRPSPAPVVKPQDGIVPTAPAKAAETPSPLKREETNNQAEQPKTEVKTMDANAATNKLSAGNKAGNGASEKPPQILVTPNTTELIVKPAPLTKSVLKVQ